MKKAERKFEIGEIIWNSLFRVIPIICIVSLILTVAPISIIPTLAKIIFEGIGAVTLIPSLIALYCYITR